MIVYFYVYVYVYMYICIYVYMYICIYVYMYICICICIFMKRSGFQYAIKIKSRSKPLPSDTLQPVPARCELEI